MTPEERIIFISNVSVALAPSLTGGLDLSAAGPAFSNPGDPSQFETLARRAYEAAEAIVALREAKLAKLPGKEADHA